MRAFRRVGLGAALAVTLTSYGVSVANDREKLAMARLRLTTEAQTLPPNCTLVGAVKDDSIEDLRKKVVRAGGDTGLLSFSSDDLSIIYAKAYRCPAYSPSMPPPPERPHQRRAGRADEQGDHYRRPPLSRSWIDVPLVSTRLMASWMGHHYADVIAACGPPQQVFHDGTGGRIFIWSANRILTSPPPGWRRSHDIFM